MKSHQWGFGKKITRPRITILELTSLMAKVEQRGKHWIWKGRLNPYGYPNLWWKGSYEYAHRIFYSIFRGQINAGDDVHHRCKTKNCVYPWHLLKKKHEDHASHHSNGLKEIPF